MPTFEQRFLSPLRGELTRSLREAVEFANELVRSRQLPWPLPELETALTDCEGSAAGVRRWSGYEVNSAGSGHYWPEAGFAWWSDSLQRKHVRILATRRVFPGLTGEVFPPDWESTPLAYIAPRSIALVENRGKQRLLVFCTCGAWGTPEELCWMGNSCGPCHDRVEEGHAPTPCWPLRIPGEGELDTLLFTPDGRLVVTRGTRLSLWDPENRQLLWEDDCPKIAWMAHPVCSLDGRWLAFPTRDHAIVWDLETGQRLGTAHQELQGREYLSAVEFTPDSRRLALLSFRHLTVWTVCDEGLEHERTIATNEPEARSLLVTPDGQGLLVGMRSGLIRRWSLSSWEVSDWSLRLSSGVTFMANQGDTVLAVDGHDAVGRLWDFRTGEVTATIPQTYQSTTTGRNVFLTYEDGWLFRDFETGRPLARFRRPYETPVRTVDRGFAISPDGCLLAIIRDGSESVALYPMSVFDLTQEGVQ